MNRLTHVDAEGKARMVDVSQKPPTSREAVAKGSILMKAATIRIILEKAMPKGDVIAVARVAGIMAAKKTSELIPMCHSLNLTHVNINIRVDAENNRIDVESAVKCTGQTGVEMEALTAVSASLLTIYDMCKAVDKGMTISDIMLIEKRGGKSGEFRRPLQD